MGSCYCRSLFSSQSLDGLDILGGQYLCSSFSLAACFDDANDRLCGFPPPWARHHASSTMASEPDPDDDEPSYTRGYRAALYGYLRHSAD